MKEELSFFQVGTAINFYPEHMSISTWQAKRGKPNVVSQTWQDGARKSKIQIINNIQGRRNV